MNQQEEIIEKIHHHDERIGGWDTMYQYINTVYAWLNKLKRGRVCTVSELVDAENIEIFTEIIKLYICETDTTIRFIRNDFKQFRRN